MVVQKTTEKHSILVAVIPNDMLGKMPHDISEMEVFMMPQTVFTGKYPQIKVNTDTVKPRPDLIGMGIEGILKEPIWAIKEVTSKDYMGISLKDETRADDLVDPDVLANLGSDIY